MSNSDWRLEHDLDEVLDRLSASFEDRETRLLETRVEVAEATVDLF